MYLNESGVPAASNLKSKESIKTVKCQNINAKKGKII